MTSVEINGKAYPADFALFSRTPLESNVQVQDSDAEPGERALSRFGWKRSQTDFIYGAGQEWFDQEDDAERRRFYESKGWSIRERGQLTQTYQGSLIQSFTSSAGNAGVEMLSGGAVVAWGDDEAYRISNDGGTSTAYSGIPGAGIADLVVIDDQAVLVNASTGGLEKATSGSTAFSTWGSLTSITGLVVASSRLLAFQGAALIEIDDAGAQFGSTIFTHPFTNFVWKGGVSAPNGVYLWGDDGVTSNIYLLVPTDATGEFTPPFPASDWPKGELITSMIAYGGLVGISSDRGFRMAQIGGSGFLSYGPVRDNLGGFVDCDASGELAFVPVANIDVNGDTTNSGVIEFSLKAFADTLSPAYSLALADDMGSAATPEAIGVIRRSSGEYDPIMCIVNNTSGNREIWMHSAALDNSLVFRPGKTTYGIAEEKQFLSVRFDLLEVYSTDVVTAVVSVDGIEFPLVIERGGTTPGESPNTYICRSEQALSGVVFDVVITVTVTETDTAVRNLLRMERWTVRSMPLAKQVEMIEVGVILDPETGERGRHLNDHYGQWMELHELAQSKAICTMKIGDHVDTGYVDALMAARGQTKDSLARSESGTYLSGLWTVRFVAADDASF